MDAKEQVQEVNEETLHSETPETDWKAMARKWEKRAKENESAAKELQRFKEEQMSDLEKAIKRAEEAERSLSEHEQKNKNREIKEAIAKEFKVPANLIAGADEEEMRSWADRLSEYTKPNPAPKAPINGTFAKQDKPQEDGYRKLAKQLFQ